MNKNKSPNVPNNSLNNENDFNTKHFNLSAKSSFGKIKKFNTSFKNDAGRISYDSGDFRKKFDLFIKNINEQTKNNLMDPKRRKTEALNVGSPKDSFVKKNHKNT